MSAVFILEHGRYEHEPVSITPCLAEIPLPVSPPFRRHVVNRIRILVTLTGEALASLDEQDACLLAGCPLSVLDIHT